MRKLLNLIVISLFLSACTYQIESNVDSIKNTIESFYNTQYDAYLEMEYKDITPYLDMTKIQNQNKVIALEALTVRRKYTDEKGYCYVEKRRFPLTFSYKTIDIKSDCAKVILEIKIDRQQVYPPFITYGENIFELKKDGANWKITSHIYPGLNIFEVSTDKKLPELDIEKIKQQIDNEFRQK
ncbi:hypothetical protein [Caloranaerobacter ferrireducens]|uniref:hypothetical protein n=1 Tax=Caloranaerobacter ferrireducens TaxID=1323370 RepID=UPI00084DA555|nr:hypothetical protein [Caloranaerobacter ferrireducens]